MQINPLKIVGIIFYTLFLLLNINQVKAKPIKLKVGTIISDGSPVVEKWAKVHKKIIEKCSEKKIKVRLFTGGMLGDEITMVEKVKNGSLQLWAGSFGALSTVKSDLLIFDLPFLFKTSKEVDFVFYQIVQKALSEVVNDDNFLFVGYGEVGWRSIFSRKPVNGLSDLKNMKIRAQQSPVHISIWKALGGIPRPIGTTEIMKALQAGIIDGFDQALTFTFASSWYVHTKYLTLTKHIYLPGIVVINTKFFNKLTPELQKCILLKRDEMAKSSIQGMRELSSSLLPIFKEAGLQISTISESERAKMKSATEHIWDELKKKISPKAKKLLNEMLLIRNEFRNRINNDGI